MTLWSPDPRAALPSLPSAALLLGDLLLDPQDLPRTLHLLLLLVSRPAFPGKSVHSLARSPPCSGLTAHTQLWSSVPSCLAVGAVDSQGQRPCL